MRILENILTYIINVVKLNKIFLVAKTPEKKEKGMWLTIGKKVNSSFVVITLIVTVIGGLVLHRITGSKATNQTMLKIITPSMIGVETLCGLALSTVRGSISSGNERYIQDLENRNNAAHLYFNLNLASLCKSIDEKADELLTILEGMPSSEMAKDAQLATAHFRAGIAHSGFAISEFLKMPDEAYVKEYEAAVVLRKKGLADLQVCSKWLTGSAQELIDNLRDEDEQLINHAKRVFEIQRGNDYQFNPRYLKEKFVYNP